MEFSEVVRRRRIVRHFASDPIPRAVLERIAAAAQRAPSAGFSQGQRVVIVTDPDRRRRLAELVGEGFYTERGFDPWISEAPALFVPCVSARVYVDRYNEPDKRDPSAAARHRGRLEGPVLVDGRRLHGDAASSLRPSTRVWPAGSPGATSTAFGPSWACRTTSRPSV